jgi:hypothetical protein
MFIFPDFCVILMINVILVSVSFSFKNRIESDSDSYHNMKVGNTHLLVYGLNFLHVQNKLEEHCYGVTVSSAPFLRTCCWLSSHRCHSVLYRNVYLQFAHVG